MVSLSCQILLVQTQNYSPPKLEKPYFKLGTNLQSNIKVHEGSGLDRNQIQRQHQHKASLEQSACIRTLMLGLRYIQVGKTYGTPDRQKVLDAMPN